MLVARTECLRPGRGFNHDFCTISRGSPVDPRAVVRVQDEPAPAAQVHVIPSHSFLSAGLVNQHFLATMLGDALCSPKDNQMENCIVEQCVSPRPQRRRGTTANTVLPTCIRAGCAPSDLGGSAPTYGPDGLGKAWQKRVICSHSARLELSTTTGPSVPRSEVQCHAWCLW
jgi:hypothetical protein